MNKNNSNGDGTVSFQKGASPKPILEGASPKGVGSGQSGASPTNQTTESKPPPKK